MHNGIGNLAQTLRTTGRLGPNTVLLEELKSDQASRQEASELAHALLGKSRVAGEDLDPLPNQIDWNGWKGSVNQFGDVIAVNVHKGSDYRYVETRFDEPASVYIRASDDDGDSFQATALFQQESLKLVRQGHWSEIDTVDPTPPPTPPPSPPPANVPPDSAKSRENPAWGAVAGLLAGGLVFGAAAQAGYQIPLASALAAGCLLGAPLAIWLHAGGKP